MNVTDIRLSYNLEWFQFSPTVHITHCPPFELTHILHILTSISIVADLQNNTRIANIASSYPTYFTRDFPIAEHIGIYLDIRNISEKHLHSEVWQNHLVFSKSNYNTHFHFDLNKLAKWPDHSASHQLTINGHNLYNSPNEFTFFHPCSASHIDFETRCW